MIGILIVDVLARKKIKRYKHISYDENKNNLFYWTLIRDQVKADFEIARNSVKKN